MFQVEADAAARDWFETHRRPDPLVIAYDVRRCCGGGKICSVDVRARSNRDRSDTYAVGQMPDGTRVLIDLRAARRLPERFTLTVRGIGPLKHLDLALDGEQWGELLYT